MFIRSLSFLVQTGGGQASELHETLIAPPPTPYMKGKMMHVFLSGTELIHQIPIAYFSLVLYT